MFTHIINPVAADPGSRFHFIQMTTFQSMLTARAQAGGQSILLLSAQYPEDHAMLPPGFTTTADLTRSVLDVGKFEIPRKLPILQDILQQAAENSQSEFIIYTNVDIGLQPHFYQSIAHFIQQGYDAFVINRRTIADHYTKLSQLDEMFADRGKPHRGWDCFVFPHSWVPDLKLGTICIGAPLVGLALISNLVAIARNFHEFRDVHLTFHLGDDKAWNRKQLNDYRQHNYTQLMQQLNDLVEIHGNFPYASPPARFLRWQSNPFKAAIYQFYARYPLPLQIARYIKKDDNRSNEGFL